MSIQLAGFAGSNVFKAADAPRYRSGLLICGGCTLAGTVIVLCWKAVYAWDEKRKGSNEPVVSDLDYRNRDEGAEDVEAKL